jgi:hypothetical protein
MNEQRRESGSRPACCTRDEEHAIETIDETWPESTHADCAIAQAGEHDDLGQ